MVSNETLTFIFWQVSPQGIWLPFLNKIPDFFFVLLLGEGSRGTARKKKYTVFYKGKWEAILSSVLRLRDIHAGFDTLFPCLDSYT